jgi:hypothetical protein
MHTPDTVPPGKVFNLAIEQKTRWVPGSISMLGRTKHLLLQWELNHDPLVIQPILCHHVKLYVKALLNSQFQVHIIKKNKKKLFKG